MTLKSQGAKSRELRASSLALVDGYTCCDIVGIDSGTPPRNGTLTKRDGRASRRASNPDDCEDAIGSMKDITGFETEILRCGVRTYRSGLISSFLFLVRQACRHGPVVEGGAGCQWDSVWAAGGRISAWFPIPL